MQKEPSPPWKSERHHLPNVVTLDATISNLERLIWEETYPKYNSTKATDQVIRSPEFDSPYAAMRNQLLEVRNRLAQICALKERKPHDYSETALGYKVINGQPHVLDKVAVDMMFSRPV